MALLDDEGMVGSELSEQAVNSLRSMSNWMLFPAFLGVFISFIGSIGVISGIATFLFLQRNTAELAGMLVAFLFYGAIFGLMFATSFFLMRSAFQNKAFIKKQDMSQLEKAFASRRKFCMYLGISMVLFTLLVLFIIAVLFLVMLPQNDSGFIR